MSFLRPCHARLTFFSFSPILPFLPSFLLLSLSFFPLFVCLYFLYLCLSLCLTEYFCLCFGLSLLCSLLPSHPLIRIFRLVDLKKKMCFWACVMAHWIRVLAIKPDNLSLVP